MLRTFLVSQYSRFANWLKRNYGIVIVLIGLLIVTGTVFAAPLPVVTLYLEQPYGTGFGYTVATDGITTVVGQPLGNQSSGYAYVFRKENGYWVPAQRLLVPSYYQNVSYGFDIDVDGNTILIGAYGYGKNGFYSGAAFVYVKQGETWQLQAELYPSDPEAYSSFGVAVELEGDTAIVSADVGNNDSGVVYAFKRTGTTWAQTQRIVAPDPGVFKHFGQAIALSGNTLLVSSPLDSPGVSQVGSVYVFTRVTTTWTYRTKLVASDRTLDHWQFGTSVALENGVAVVGSINTDNPTMSSGSLYVYRGSGTSWVEEQIITVPDATIYDNLGCSVSISGTRILAGACGYDRGTTTDAGAAYLFEYNGSNWVTLDRYVYEYSSRELGRGVAISGTTMFVGIPHSSIQQTANGMVHVLNYNGTELVSPQYLYPSTAYYFPQVASITGTVYASDGVTPLANVPVETDHGNVLNYIRACTDANGNYTLQNLHVNEGYKIRAGGRGWWGCDSTFYTLEYWKKPPQLRVLQLSHLQYPMK
jgi:hypothetical protein